MPSTPLLFTLPPSNRHEVILLDDELTSKPGLKALNKLITSTIQTSPNCAEFMNKYKPTDAPAELIQELKIRWSTQGRENKSWPECTVVNEGNLGAVLRLVDPGRDVLEVRVGKGE